MREADVLESIGATVAYDRRGAGQSLRLFMRSGACDRLGEAAAASAKLRPRSPLRVVVEPGGMSIVDVPITPRLLMAGLGAAEAAPQVNSPMARSYLGAPESYLGAPEAAVGSRMAAAAAPEALAREAATSGAPLPRCLEAPQVDGSELPPLPRDTRGCREAKPCPSRRTLVERPVTPLPKISRVELPQRTTGLLPPSQSLPALLRPAAAASNKRLGAKLLGRAPARTDMMRLMGPRGGETLRLLRQRHQATVRARLGGWRNS